MNKLTKNRFVCKIKDAFLRKRETKDEQEEDTSEISSDLLGFNMNTLFEMKNKRRKKVHQKKDSRQQAKTFVPQALDKPNNFPTRKRASAQYSQINKFNRNSAELPDSTRLALLSKEIDHEGRAQMSYEEGLNEHFKKFDSEGFENSDKLPNTKMEKKIHSEPLAALNSRDTIVPGQSDPYEFLE